jgi:hypothetical protein
MRTIQQQQEERRRKKLAQIRRQVATGSLVIRQMTDAERGQQPSSDAKQKGP